MQLRELRRWEPDGQIAEWTLDLTVPAAATVWRQRPAARGWCCGSVRPARAGRLGTEGPMAALEEGVGPPGLPVRAAFESTLSQYPHPEAGSRGQDTT